MTAQEMIVESPLLAERVEENRSEAVHLLMLHVPVPSVVSFGGSFVTHPNFAAGDELLQELAVLMLDKGTRSRDRFSIAEFLENRGAQLHFASDGLRVRFSGRALSADVADVMEICAEQLREPLFDEAEFVKAKAQLAAKLHHAIDSTGSQASAALSRQIYGAGHPNYMRSPQEDLQRLDAFSLEHVVEYHRLHLGTSEFTLALAGDLDSRETVQAVDRAFGQSPPRSVQSSFAAHAESRPAGEERIAIPDKANIDVRMGHGLGVLRQDVDFIPLYVANYVLGGNFSARLMATIRDEMGLTYGIRSALSGITTLHEGHWLVAVTLSREALDRGIEATKAEIERFVRDGITEEELAEKKTTITGAYKVGLATTSGLASALLHNAERGFEVDYLDRHPDEVDGVTLDQVNRVVQQHFHPDQMHVALTGSL